MAMFTNKTTGASGPMDTNDAKNSGGYWETDLIPIGVPIKYLKQGDNAWTPIEMTPEEKATVDASDLVIVKQLAVQTLRDKGHTAVFAMFPGVDEKAFMAGMPYPVDTINAVRSAALAQFNKITGQEARIATSTTAEQVNEILAE